MHNLVVFGRIGSTPDAAIIGKALGHRSPQATAIYARLTQDPVRQALENAQAALADPGNCAGQGQALTSEETLLYFCTALPRHRQQRGWDQVTTAIDLSNLDKNSESETLELKESFDGKALETIGAFANSSGGTI